MKKGFELIEFRELNENVDFLELESKYELILPPILKTCIRHFKLESELKNLKFMDSENTENQLGTVKFESENISLLFNNFICLKDIYIEWNGGGKFEEWMDYGVVRIGHFGEVGGGGLCVGCSEINMDEIWQLNWDDKNSNRKITNNIFEFIRGLKFTTEFSELKEDEYTKLYKKWGDSHWRYQQ
jgi:hypothetical protein